MIVHSCILLEQVKYIAIKKELTTNSFKIKKKNQKKKKTATKQFIILDFFIKQITLTCKDNELLNVLMKSKYSTPTPFGRVSCFVKGVCLALSNYVFYIQEYTSDILSIGTFLEVSEKQADNYQSCRFNMSMGY